MIKWYKNFKKPEEKNDWSKQFPQLMNNLEDSVPIFNVKKKKSGNWQTPTIIAI